MPNLEETTVLLFFGKGSSGCGETVFIKMSINQDGLCYPVEASRETGCVLKQEDRHIYFSRVISSLEHI